MTRCTCSDPDETLYHEGADGARSIASSIEAGETYILDVGHDDGCPMLRGYREGTPLIAYETPLTEVEQVLTRLVEVQR